MCFERPTGETRSNVPITSLDWTAAQQRKPSFSQWLNSESFQLKQRGGGQPQGSYGATDDYGTIGRGATNNGGVAAASASAQQRHPNGDVAAMTLVDPHRGVMMTCHDGTIRATPTTAARQLGGLTGKNLSAPPGHPSLLLSNQLLGSDSPQVKNHVMTNGAAVHPQA